MREGVDSGTGRACREDGCAHLTNNTRVVMRDELECCVTSRFGSDA